MEICRLGKTVQFDESLILNWKSIGLYLFLLHHMNNTLSIKWNIWINFFMPFQNLKNIKLLSHFRKMSEMTKKEIDCIKGNILAEDRFSYFSHLQQWSDHPFNEKKIHIIANQFNESKLWSPPILHCQCYHGWRKNWV